MKVVKILFITFGLIILIYIIFGILYNLYPKTMSRGVFKMIFSYGYYFSNAIEYSEISYKGDTIELLLKARKDFSSIDHVRNNLLNDLNDSSKSLIDMELDYAIIVIVDSSGLTKKITSDLETDREHQNNKNNNGY